MSKGSKVKKLTRELQDLSKDTVSYSACKRLLSTRGFEAAKEQILEWVRQGDNEIARMKGKTDGSSG